MSEIGGRHVLVSIFANLLLLTFAFSQGTTANSNEKNTLTDQAAELVRFGKLDDAIKIAKKVVSLEKKSRSADSTSYVNAVLNLARMKRNKFLLLREKASARDLVFAEVVGLLDQASDAAADADGLYREVIEVSETAGRQRSTQVADAKSELAWLMNNYSALPRPVPVIGIRSRIDQAEALFSESLELNNEIRGNDADQTLIVVIAFGNFYLKYDNYEKALPFYERYIQTIEKKHGQKAAELVNVLRPFAQILYATLREEECNAAIKRIEEITGRKEDLPLGKLGLYTRSKDAVAFDLERAQAAQTKWVAGGGSRSVSARTKNVQVRTTVDTAGKVIEAIAETNDANLRKRAEQEVLKWFIRPFIYNGEARNLRGYVTYRELL
ncbi:MAG: tetratricopeptide repeat protein [Acidobacteriota bacterium]